MTAVSRETAKAELARILRSWPNLRGSLAVVELEGEGSPPGGFALRVSGASSWRIVRIGDGEHESRRVFAETGGAG